MVSSRRLAQKGHFVVYCDDGERFEVPLAYLKRDLFRELLRASEDVFGLPGAKPITLPCNAAFMGCVVSCLRRRVSSQEAERSLLASVAARRCSAAPCGASSWQSEHRVVVCRC